MKNYSVNAEWLGTLTANNKKEAKEKALEKMKTEGWFEIEVICDE